MDIYFTEEYGKLCELIEGGNSETFHYNTELGKINHMFIKRTVPCKVNDIQYYDLITPYGYGGPIILEAYIDNIDTLVEDFENKFQMYCKANKIVCEFVRFHPIYENVKYFGKMYNAQMIRKTLGTNLEEHKDPVQSEFSKSCRKNIRQALNKGISYRVTEKPKNINSFIEIYYSTMDRDKANEFYYFSKEYFETAISLLRDNIIFVEAIYNDKTIAAGFYFVSDGNIHIHLSGTLSEYLFLSPAYILRYAVTMWGKKNGYKMIHHGGGTSNSPNNTLYQFKKRFARCTEFDFCIGKRIWDKEKYKEICEIMCSDWCDDFFPAYRKR